MKTSEKLCKRESARETVTNVDAQSYKAKAKAFMEVDAVSRGTDFLGVTINIHKHRNQWGAWRAYFARKKISHRFMNDRGREDYFTKPDMAKGYQVPTEWPHQFDAEHDEYDDHLAGDRFLTIVAGWARRGDKLTPEQRKDAVKAAMARAREITPKH